MAVNDGAPIWPICSEISQGSIPPSSSPRISATSNICEPGEGRDDDEKVLGGRGSCMADA
jgi:hypothetical protein